jgi:hypothetical protein
MAVLDWPLRRKKPERICDAAGFTVLIKTDSTNTVE